jgi:hypothetical protein
VAGVLPAAGELPEREAAQQGFQETLVTVRETRAAARSEREGSQTEQKEEPVAPVVRVTIGRVEVKAVHPPAAAPSPPPASSVPTLSLDEYLRQFRQGPR